MGGILKIALELFVLYILYKLIFDFAIPIYRTTKAMKGKINEMQEKMQDQHKNSSINKTETSAKQQPENHDYIDFEEVK